MASPMYYTDNALMRGGMAGRDDGQGNFVYDDPSAAPTGGTQAPRFEAWNDPGLQAWIKQADSGQQVRPYSVGGYSLYPVPGGFRVWQGGPEDSNKNGIIAGEIDRNGYIPQSGFRVNSGSTTNMQDFLTALAVVGGGYLAGGALAGAAGGAGAGGAGAAGMGAADAAAMYGVEAGAGAGAFGGGAGGLGGALTAAELEAAALTGGSTLTGPAATAAYSGLGTVAPEAMAAAMGMTPEAFAALGAGGLGSAGASAGMLEGTAAAGGAGGAGATGGGGGATGATGAGAGGAGAAGGLGSTAGGFNWGSLVGPGLGLVGGLASSGAAKDAAETQVQAQREAAALSEPWRAAGVKGLNRMTEVLGIGGDPNAEGYGSMVKPFAFNNDDPSYKFRFDEGMKGLTSQYGNKGKFFSGAAMKGVTNYGQGAASQEYSRAFDRDTTTKTNTFNKLASVAGTGQTAANTIGGYTSNAGDAKAAGTVGASNAMWDAVSKGWNSYQSSQDRQYENALMERMLRSRGGYA